MTPEYESLIHLLTERVVDNTKIAVCAFAIVIGLLFYQFVTLVQSIRLQEEVKDLHEKVNSLSNENETL
jgi:uncharacterized integral membrane protein